jgi:hypothetical protein
MHIRQCILLAAYGEHAAKALPHLSLIHNGRESGIYPSAWRRRSALPRTKITQAFN